MISIKIKTRHALGGWPGSDGIAKQKQGMCLFASKHIITEISVAFNYTLGDLA